MKKPVEQIMAIAVGISILSSASTYIVSASDGHSLAERYPAYTGQYYNSDTQLYYRDYLLEGEQKNWQNANSAGVSVDLSQAKTSDGQEHYSADRASFVWDSDEPEWVEWTFTVEQSGYYSVYAEYTALEGTVDSPRRAIQIDNGKVDYKEMSNIVFSRKWKDSGEPKTNLAGDQVRPKQEELREKQRMWIYDALGRYEEPLKFYLEAGEHTIRFTFIQDYIELHSLTIKPFEELKTYEEQLAEWRAEGYKDATASIKIDGEKASGKSDSSIRLEYSSDPLADPPSQGGYTLNAIGGAGWNKGGQSISWTFTAEETGLYKIDLRAYQKYNDSLSVYRQIAIDGEVPFQEFQSFELEYGKWNTVSIDDENGNPYLIFLEKGEHTLTMTVKTTGYTEVLYSLEKALDSISKTIQSVIMITGIEPDVNFDYQLFDKIPWLKEEYQKIDSILTEQIEALSNGSNKIPAPVNSLSTIRYRIRQFIDDPFTIARNLDNIIEDQTSLSSWIREFNNSPLMIDYLLISAPAEKVENKHANIFQSLWFVIRNFALSFTKDYDSISGTVTADGKEVKNITGWISRGKEWSEILKQISDEEFTEKTGINVNFNMLPAGQLGTGGIMLLAVSSGTAPDFVIGSDSLTPAEYGMRDVLIDLSTMDGYEEVEKRFLEGVMTPYRFDGKVYALPETMDFSVMYYRKDILSSLNLKLPETWDDLYNDILPELRRNGMDFWYEGGLNTFLFQNGAEFYTADGKASALDTQEAYQAFKQFGDLYKIYDVPISANFYTRFRAGQMPLGISSFNTYLQLTSAAPELEGKWGAAMIPGTRQADGTINRGNNVGSTSMMIFSTADDVESCWEFAKWYTGTETQTRYAGDLVAYIGSEAKWCSANIEAFDTLSWDNTFKKVIKEQRQWCRSMPSVVGGYITARHIENARVRSVIQGMNYRESIERAAKDITRELQLKNEEFEQRKSLGK